MELSQEIEILKRVRHSNIIQFHDYWYNNTEFVFITELMTSGTLREYIKKLQIPNLRIVKRYFYILNKRWSRQILKGLAYLHSHAPPIIHRDIKCDNIFINGAHGEVKIGDMGSAKMKRGKKYTVIGTPEFMAPVSFSLIAGNVRGKGLQRKGRYLCFWNVHPGNGDGRIPIQRVQECRANL
jgi:serine/threonine protein kinase